MTKFFTVLSIFLLSAMISTAQNEKIAKFYDTKAGSGYYGINDDVAYIGDSIMIFQLWSDECGYELWRTNGTDIGTYMIKDINPDLDYYETPISSGPEYFHSYKGEVYFRASDNTHGFELWKTDGTEAGTTIVKDIYEGGSGALNPTAPVFCMYNDELYFQAKSSNEIGQELWKTDGTEAGTIMVKNILAESDKSSRPDNFILYNDLLFFTAETTYNYPEIWYTDGTNEGTLRLSELPIAETPRTEELMVFNGMLVFKGNLDNGLELWKTDGTSVGTMEIKDINPGTGWGAPYEDNMVEINGELYFKGQTEDSGSELWKTDGTSAGTILVKDINPGTTGSDPNYLCVFDNKLFFTSNNGDSGTELWISDGTIDGTQLYYDTYIGGSGGPGSLFSFNSRLFFTANTNAYGQPNLYSMGSSEEMPVTHQALDFTFKTYQRYFGLFFTLKNTLCFQADIEENTGFELYKLVNEDVTSISKLENQDVSIYPNPTADIVMVDLSRLSGSDSQYSVYNHIGQLLETKKVKASKKINLNLSAYKVGIYFIKIEIDNEVYMHQIIKK